MIPSRNPFLFLLLLPLLSAPSADAAAGSAAPSGDAAGVIQLQAPGQDEWKTEKKEFSATAQRDGVTTLLQRGEYTSSGVKVQAEMGDLAVEETPNILTPLGRRGVKLSLLNGTGENALRLESYALTGARRGNDKSMVLGASGEISLFSRLARIKTVYVSSRETLRPGARIDADGTRRGDVIGVVAVLEPFRETLVAELEADYAIFNPDSAEGAAATGDKAYRAKVSGHSGPYRYGALYERTGPRYRLLNSGGPRRDWEGVALSFGRDFRCHGVDCRLSRYNDNVEKSDLVPRLYRYEGMIDYSFKKIQALPLGVQYTKALVASGREPVGTTTTREDEDTLSGRVKYLGGEWEVGMRASYYQHSDRMRDERDRTATTIALLPKFTAGPVTLSPDLSLRRAMNYLERQRTDEYAAGLDISGNVLDRKLDYQVRGGYRKVLADDPSSCNQKLGANLRLGYPLGRILDGFSGSLLGLRGEYNGVSYPARRDDTYSLLLVLEGGGVM